MKKYFLLAFLCASVLHAQTVFEENFEHPEKISFKGFHIEAKNPSSGKYCAHLVTPPKAKSDVCYASGKIIIPVEPQQWYRLSLKTRNDIKNGEIKFGVQESRSREKRISKHYYEWHWKAASLNMPEWRTNVKEFKTGPHTIGIIIYIRTKTMFSGSSWWDDIKLEKFEKKFPPVEIKPFKAPVSFTDIPTKSAYTLTNGKPAPITYSQAMEFLWEELDLAKARIEVQYRDLPENSLLRTSLIRGTDIPYREERKLRGSGTASFNIGFGKLPEGIYRFHAELVQGGKAIFCAEKELWRINSRKIASPKLEKICTSSVGEGRQCLVNGEIFNQVYTTYAPTWGMFPEHKKLCKPDVETYFRTLQEQFGQNTFTVWTRRRSNDYVQQVIADFREYLDFLQRMNCYGKVELTNFFLKNEKPNLEYIRRIVRGVKDHPALLAWAYDEPEVYNYSPEDMKQLCDVIRKEDPNHIVGYNLCQPDKFHKYAPYSDIASYDCYPFPNESLIENHKRTQLLLKAFPKAPYSSALQMFNFLSMEMPSFDQVRAMFMLDRLHGSHSLCSFVWAQHFQCFLTDPELQSYYKAIVFMFRRMEPVLRNRAQKQIALAASHEYVISGTFEDGKDQVLIMVNISNDTAADVSFAHPAKAEDFFDGQWKYTQVQGKYKFRLKPNGTKVIRLKRK